MSAVKGTGGAQGGECASSNSSEDIIAAYPPIMLVEIPVRARKVGYAKGGREENMWRRRELQQYELVSFINKMLDYKCLDDAYVNFT